MRVLLLSVVLALVPVASGAQTPTTGPLREMLSQVPAFQPGESIMVEFGDLSAARALDFSRVDGASRDPEIAALRALPSTFREGAFNPDGWRMKVGFGPPEMSLVVRMAAVPRSATVLRLNPGAAIAIPQVLEASGYSRIEVAGVAGWAKGRDFMLDRNSRDVEDPFIGPLGLASRIQVDGDLVRHASGWPLLRALTDTAVPRMTSVHGLGPILSVLDRLGGAHRLLGAALFQDASQLGLDRPPVIAGRGDGQATPSPAGWGLGLVADLTDGPVSTAVLAIGITLPGAAAATALRDGIATGWTSQPAYDGRSYASATGATAEVSVVPAGDGQWVLVLVARGATAVHGGAITRNIAYERLRVGIQMRDLVFIKP